MTVEKENTVPPPGGDKSSPILGFLEENLLKVANAAAIPRT